MAGGLAILLPLAFLYLGLRASLPTLDGKVEAHGLAKVAYIERDALGMATIEAVDRVDLAYATGYAHAQDRFFQMDLSRRLAAGELTPLFGEVASAQDAKALVFGFRSVARRVLEQATPMQRKIVESYTRGVNAGLASLSSRPFEYWVLRSKPAEWRPEDTVLVVHAMWWELQYAGLQRERLRRQIDARLGGPVTSSGWKRASCFLSPADSGWDAPNESGLAQPPTSREPIDCETIPSAGELNVRDSSLRVGRVSGHGNSRWSGYLAGDDQGGLSLSDVGSNNWALAGSRTALGGALVASDMHLGLRVPGVWYRARLKSKGFDVSGLTLPGAPVLVAGSNGSIAWSYSNSYGDWLEVEERACDAVGGRAIRFEGPDAQGRCAFASWLAMEPEATNLRLLDLEKARSVEDAMALAPLIGIPHQNLIVGDRAGHIGWTIIGRIARAQGAGGSEGSSLWLTASEQPRIVDPSSGQLWSANSLATDSVQQQQLIGGDEALLGADYDLGARARQIRDDLAELRGKQATEGDMLAIQLDDRAVFLARWHDLLLGLLDEPAVRDEPDRAELKTQILNWDARAAIDSQGYRLVRDYRDRVEASVWQMIVQSLGLNSEAAPPPARFERPLWALVTQRPAHLLAATYPDWRSFLLAQADATWAHGRQCNDVRPVPDGCFEPVRIRHPLSQALPLLSPLLDMKPVALPGDRNMPRVQAAAFGASERFAVTPGREAAGYLHIAGGQSGHPLSPYYRAGFAEWAAGKPLPFLPGAAQHRLELRPR